MVSADNLNLDVLEMIFSHLWGKDLASVALVSRSFLAGVIPRLYRNLLFRLQQGKKYPLVGFFLFHRRNTRPVIHHIGHVTLCFDFITPWASRAC
jgi:hypothetical protein